MNDADIIDPWVMDRLNILKRRGELNANNKVTDCVQDDEGNKASNQLFIKV